MKRLTSKKRTMKQFNPQFLAKLILIFVCFSRSLWRNLALILITLLHFGTGLVAAIVVSYLSFLGGTFMANPMFNWKFNCWIQFAVLLEFCHCLSNMVSQLLSSKWLITSFIFCKHFISFGFLGTLLNFMTQIFFATLQ